jgi:hypothetical protein
LLLVSDEIHCDLVFAGAKHTPTIAAAPEIADRLITCVAATKTFNLAGAHVGACFTTNPALKRRLDARIMASGLGSYNLFGMTATEAAWRTGDAWLDALLPYLARNRDMLDVRIEARHRRPLHAPRRHLSRVGRFLRNRPAPRGDRRPGEEAARASLPALAAVRTGRRDLAALQLRHPAPDPRRRRSAGWRRVSGICDGWK